MSSRFHTPPPQSQKKKENPSEISPSKGTYSERGSYRDDDVVQDKTPGKGQNYCLKSLNTEEGMRAFHY